MTARSVDLGRVRRALARLDRVTAEHPELATAEARARLDAWIVAEEREDPRSARSSSGPDMTPEEP